MFRRSERRDDAPDEATRAARAAASQAFLALDDEQRAAADAVRTADELGGGRPLGPEWAQVARAGDRATEAYLATTAQFPLDGTGPVAGARQADERALREIEAARETIRRFRPTHARTLDEAAHLLRALPVAVQEARSALVTARTAVQTADASGTRSRRAAEQLAEAEQPRPGIDAAGGIRDGGRRPPGPSNWPWRRPRSPPRRPGPRRVSVRRSAASPPAGRRRPPRPTGSRPRSRRCAGSSPNRARWTSPTPRRRRGWRSGPSTGRSRRPTSAPTRASGTTRPTPSPRPARNSARPNRRTSRRGAPRRAA